MTGIAGRGIMELDLDFYKDLLYLSAFRGKHSTGVAGITTRNSIYTLRKHAVAPAEFIDTYGGTKGFLSNIHQDIQMAHARYATRGAVNDDNAHPFDTKKYIGAHNGTLTDSRFQSRDKTDSEMMFNEMDQKGIVETLSSLNPSSAWAVSIYDKVTRKLWLGRNSKRTLFVSFIRGADVMVWSSEQEMIEFAANRDRMVNLTTYRLLPGKLYEIDIRQIKNDKHTPWIVHDLPTPKDPLLEAAPVRPPRDDWRSSTKISEWDGVMNSEGWEDADSYVFDKATGQYLVRQRSEISKIVDELEESVSESRKAEESFRNNLLI